MFGNPRKLSNNKEIVPLSFLCHSINDGTHKTPNYVPCGVPFVTVKNITTGRLDFSNTKFISQAEHEELTKRTKPERGDILVSKDGTIGVPCPVQTDTVFSIFVSVALLKPKADIVDQIFLATQLASEWVQEQIRVGTKGIAIRHLHLTDFKRLKILLPPLPLQQEFARRVEAVEKLKAAHRASLSELDVLFASLQHRAFRGEL
jgi:type I restriction enzyme S subunit